MDSPPHQPQNREFCGNLDDPRETGTEPGLRERRKQSTKAENGSAPGGAGRPGGSQEIPSGPIPALQLFPTAGASHRSDPALPLLAPLGGDSCPEPSLAPREAPGSRTGMIQPHSQATDALFSSLAGRPSKPASGETSPGSFPFPARSRAGLPEPSLPQRSPGPAPCGIPARARLRLRFHPAVPAPSSPLIPGAGRRLEQGIVSSGPSRRLRAVQTERDIKSPAPFFLGAGMRRAGSCGQFQRRFLSRNSIPRPRGR